MTSTIQKVIHTTKRPPASINCIVIVGGLRWDRGTPPAGSDIYVVGDVWSDQWRKGCK